MDQIFDLCINQSKNESWWDKLSEEAKAEIIQISKETDNDQNCLPHEEVLLSLKKCL